MTSGQESPGAQEQRAVEMTIQRVIDDLASSAAGADPTTIQTALTTALEEAGIVGMPAPWLETVAAGLAQGNAYVVSELTRTHAHIPPPRHRVRSEHVD